MVEWRRKAVNNWIILYYYIRFEPIFIFVSEYRFGEYIAKIPKDYNIPNIMIATYFTKYNEKTIFKKITFKPRQAGHNSINLIKICKIGANALKDFASFRKEMDIVKRS